MKVLHLSAFDTVGGAARASYRIHQGLQKAGVESQMLVQYKKGNDPAVSALECKARSRLRATMNSLPLKLYPQREHWFSPQWFPDAIGTKVKQLNPDIIHLNWICNGFLQIETLGKFNKPIVWTLQDMWSFTGGCHYSYGCHRYQQSCGECPHLKSNKSKDLSNWVWQRKINAWRDLNLTIVTPSSWMAYCAETSSLFKGKKIEIIPFGLDAKTFQPLEQQIARQQLDLPQNKQLILFGALNATTDTRKGFHLLQAALKNLSQTSWRDRVELVVFGASNPDKPLDLGFPIHYLGHLQEDRSLQMAYAGADITIAPSIEEAFGQTASESLACGTPVIVFTNTGLEDIVDHQQNGYIAKFCDSEDLATGIAWVLEDRNRHKTLKQNSRSKALREYTFETQAQRYLSLYDEITRIESRSNAGKGVLQ
jgi:glycosyltransferase involved in cell wall biosynthesis